MKSLNDRYVSHHSSTSETFGDLLFCALIVVVLFVMALAIEVSQRVRSEIIASDPIEKVEVDDLADITKKEFVELTEKLSKQQAELSQLKLQIEERDRQLNEQEKVVANKLAALSGEQRFTGAREPAQFNLAYDYRKNLYYFIPSKDSKSASTRLSSESALQFSVRSTRELVALAQKARDQRGFTFDEAKAIYQAFTQYQEIIPEVSGYDIQQSKIGISYIILLSAYIVGDKSLGIANSGEILNAFSNLYQSPGEASDSMYPTAVVEVDLDSRELNLGGVTVSLRDMKEILLSFGGRGATLDLEGLDGNAPEWLIEELLTPTGYISKTPKVPN